MKVGDIICHRKDSTVRGKIVEIDDNIGDITTCKVIWDGENVPEIQWTDKLRPID